MKIYRFKRDAPLGANLEPPGLTPNVGSGIFMATKGELMACRHEGGSDSCVRHGGGKGDCKIQKRQYYRKNLEHVKELDRKRYAENRDHKRAHSREYYTQNIVTSGMHPHRAGAVAEHLAAYDLYRRGVLELTWPDDQHSADDMHARFESGWFSVQVKAVSENVKTGRLRLNRRKGISSHIVAVVGIRSGRVEYLPNKKELPEELRMVQ